MSYTARKTIVITDGAGNLVPDYPESPSRIALNQWLAAGNKLTLVDTDIPAPAPTPTPAPNPAPSSSYWALNLIGLMNEVYGEGSWTGRTGIGAGSDIAPAITLGCQKIRATCGRGEIVIPPGSWLMNAGVSPTVLSGITIKGLGSMASLVFFNCSSGAAFHWSGHGGYTGGGFHGVGIVLESGLGNTSACALLLQGDASFQPDQFSISDIYCTSLNDSYWFAGLKAIGNARTSPQGIRIADVRNVQIFKCHNTGVVLSNVVGWTLANIGCYAGTGIGNNIYLAGGGSQLTNSTQVSAYGITCSELNLTNCWSFDLSGKCQQIATNATATDGDLRFRGATLIGQRGNNVSFNGA